MKLTIILLGLLALTSAFMGCDDPAEKDDDVTAIEPIAHWEFNEMNGSILYDTSENNHNGVISNTTWVNGYNDGGLDFGESSYVTVDYNSELHPKESITVEAIISLDTILVDGAMAIVSTNHLGGYGLWSYHGNLEIFITIDSTYQIAQETVQYQPNTWYHIAGVYDGEFLRFYVNGLLKNEIAVSGLITYYYENSLQIGRDASGGSEPEEDQFYGIIDDIRITREALLPAKFLEFPH